MIDFVLKSQPLLGTGGPRLWPVSLGALKRGPIVIRHTNMGGPDTGRVRLDGLRLGSSDAEHVKLVAGEKEVAEKASWMP